MGNAVETKLARAHEEVQRAQAAVQRSKDAAVKLKEVCKLGSRLKREYSQLEREARKAIAAEQQAEYNVTAVYGALQQHEAQEPSDLPTDVELAKLQKHTEELEALLTKCAATKRDAVGLATSMRLKVRNAFNELEKLRFAEQTLVKLAAGDDPDDAASWIGSGGEAAPLMG